MNGLATCSDFVVDKLPPYQTSFFTNLLWLTNPLKNGLVVPVTTGAGNDGRDSLDDRLQKHLHGLVGNLDARLLIKLMTIIGKKVEVSTLKQGQEMFNRIVLFRCKIFSYKLLRYKDIKIVRGQTCSEEIRDARCC